MQDCQLTSAICLDRSNEDTPDVAVCPLQAQYLVTSKARNI